MTYTYQDKWLDGSPINQQVILGGEGLVFWTLPDGGRLCTNLYFYNEQFPKVWEKQHEWRNKRNKNIREKIEMGVNK